MHEPQCAILHQDAFGFERVSFTLHDEYLTFNDLKSLLTCEIASSYWSWQQNSVLSRVLSFCSNTFRQTASLLLKLVKLRLLAAVNRLPLISVKNDQSTSQDPLLNHVKNAMSHGRLELVCKCPKLSSDSESESYGRKNPLSILWIKKKPDFSVKQLMCWCESKPKQLHNPIQVLLTSA